MVRRRTVAWIASIVLVGGATYPTSTLYAQDAGTGSSAGASSKPSSSDSSDASAAKRRSNGSTGGGAATSSKGGEAVPPPSNPRERLRTAERAFQSAQFDRLPTLLKPLLEPEPVFDDPDERIRSRELLGVGYYFAAQQSTDPTRRDRLLESARTQFWELLKERPDYSLDPLIFPASVVELFESVRRQHADQLAEIRRNRSNPNGDSKAAGETLYIQRRVERHTYALNFFPFGIGQFQNGALLRGSLFAGGQAAAIGLYTTGAVWIETLRNANGRFNVGPDRSGGDFARARRWRRVQYAALGLFGGIYLWSILDALVNFERRTVHIETLDEPPSELGGEETSSIGKRPSVRIGWGYVRIRW
jgi:hypothetical protein